MLCVTIFHDFTHGLKGRWALLAKSLHSVTARIAGSNTSVCRPAAEEKSMTVMLMLKGALTGLALVAVGACGGQPTDAPVRTTSPSGTWTAPSAAQAAERDQALLRVVSAIPGVARLDLFMEGEKITAGIEYQTVTPYLAVPSGRQTLRLRPAGLDTADPLAEESQGFTPGHHYTVVLLPGGDDGPAADVRVFEDTMDPPDNGRVRLRVIHAAGDAGDVDVHVPNRAEPLAAALQFQRASDVAGLEPPAALELRPAGRSESMLRATDLGLSSGGMYTIVVIGRARTEPALRTLVIEDRIVRP